MTEPDGPREAFDFRKRLRPKTYSIAIYVVAFFLLVEAGFLLSVFWCRQEFVLETEGPSMPATAETVEEASQQTPRLTPPPSDITPPRLPVPKVATPEDRVLELNEQARTFRLNGQLDQCRITLQQALELDPKHPNTLMNLAMLEEAQDKFEDALGYWQKVVALPSLSQVQAQMAREHIALLEDRGRAEAATHASNNTQEVTVPQPPPTVTVRKPDVVIPTTPKLLSISEVVTTPAVLPAVPDTVNYDFKIKSNSLTQYLSASKMRVQIFLYDRLMTGERVPSTISARFTNANPFSQPGVTEVLRVNYTRSAQKDFQQRVFYGYVMRIYYNGELQDEKASSPELLK